MKFKVFDIEKGQYVDDSAAFFVISENGTLMTVDMAYFEAYPVEEEKMKNYRIEFQEAAA